MTVEINLKGRRIYLLGILVLVLVFVFYAFWVNYQADDGYIAFQYVKNLVNGHGLVYNPGERVEGYNDFLWLVLLAGLKIALPYFELPLIAKVVGVISGGLAIIATCLFYPYIHKKFAPIGLLAGAFLAVNSSFVAWSTAGLETNLFAFFLFIAVFAYILFLQSNKGFYLVPLIFVLVTLTRSDGLLFFGITSIHATLWLLRKKGFGSTLGMMAAWGAIFILLYGAYFAWRYSYYGFLLPNIFYAKIESSIYTYLRGFNYLKDYVRIYGWFVFLPVLFLWVLKFREAWVGYLTLLTGVYLGYLIYAGGDGLAFFRFIAYIAPLIYLLVQEGLAALWEWLSPHLGLARRYAGLAARLFVLSALWTTTQQTALQMLFPAQNRWYDKQSELYFPSGQKDNPYIWYDNYFIDRQAVAARWLERNLPPGATVASNPAGSIAYNMNLKVIDMLGLNDVHIAHTPIINPGQGRAGHEKGDGKYVLSRAPEVILMGNVAVYPFPPNEKSLADRLSLKSEHELWADPEFHAHYQMACVQLNTTGVMRYFVFYKRVDVQFSSLANVSYFGCEESRPEIGGLP